MVAEGGDAAKGSGIEVHSSMQSVEKKNSPSFFSYQNELSWHLRALKTRKHSFQTIWSHLSLALSTVAKCDLLGAPLNSWSLTLQKCGCCLEKRLSWNLTNPTGHYSPVLFMLSPTNWFCSVMTCRSPHPVPCVVWFCPIVGRFPSLMKEQPPAEKCPPVLHEIVPGTSVCMFTAENTM